MARWLVGFSLVALAGCTNPDPGTDPDPEPEDCDGSIDTDGDGVSDCDEADVWGTNPEVADSDGDGVSDGEEIDCVSDPLDGDEQCYACGWPHGDPGGLSSEGNQDGDTIMNMTVVDQCHEELPFWDLAGSYHILFMTTSWCSPCREEARELVERGEAFEEASGLDFSYVILLVQDVNSQLPDGADAEAYADEVNAWEIPVLADPSYQAFDATTWDGSLPGKVVLGPDLTILDQYTGHSDDADSFALIEQHAAQ